MACVDLTVKQITSGVTLSAYVVGESSVRPKRSGVCLTAEVISSGISLVAYAVCTVGKKTQFYLEIEPELIWVYPDFEVDNNVFSNTDWYIN